MNKKKIGIIASAVVLIAGVTGFMIWNNSYNYTAGARGRTLSSDYYMSDFKRFNGCDSFDMNLDKGGKLDFDCHINKGWAEIDVLEGDVSVFKLSGFDKAFTDYTIPEDGTYTLKVRGRHAKGYIYIGFDKDRRDKSVFNSSIGNVADINAGKVEAEDIEVDDVNVDVKVDDINDD